MFDEPVRYTPLSSMEELISQSYKTGQSSESKKAACLTGGNMIYVSETGDVYITPLRPEIPKILKENDYKPNDLLSDLALSSLSYFLVPLEYENLLNIAKEQKRAKAYEDAFKIATRKGILPVQLVDYQIETYKQFFSSYYDEEFVLYYQVLANETLSGYSVENIASFIVVNTTTMLICDEYARTFFLRTPLASSIESKLLEAGYHYTDNRDMYIRSKKMI